MFRYTNYSPFVCIGIVLLILFIIWVFWARSGDEFVGLAPLMPDEGYTGPWIQVEVEPEEEVTFVEVEPEEAVCVLEEPVNKPRKRGFVSKGERISCEAMESIYGVPFTSTWPEWLRNPETGEKLELDCYNEELKLAVEYNGEQHYKWPNFTNQSQEQFINQVRRDSFKMNMCDKHGVYLIVVPYTVKHKDIPSYLMSNLPETLKKNVES